VPIEKGDARKPVGRAKTNDPRPEGRGVSLNGHRPSASPESVSRAASDQLYRNFLGPKLKRADPARPPVPRQRSLGSRHPRRVPGPCVSFAGRTGMAARPTVSEPDCPRPDLGADGLGGLGSDPGHPSTQLS
jgi:hypothetical protein